MASADREPIMEVWDLTPKVHGQPGEKKLSGVHLKLYKVSEHDRRIWNDICTQRSYSSR